MSGPPRQGRGGRGRIALWAPPLLWAGAIFLLSSSPRPALRPPGPDLLLHMAAFALLSALLCRAFAGGLREAMPPSAALLGAGLASVYGAADEIHQAFVPGRHADPSDALADAAGAAIAAAALLAVTHLRARGRGRAALAAPPAGPRPRLTLLTREDCHLCHEALEVLESERRLRPFDLEVLDVDADRALAERFGSQVPVVLVEGRKAFKYRVDPRRLRRRLDRLAPQPAGREG